MEYDNINKPEHYQILPGVEARDIINAVTRNMTGEEAVDTANVLKYVLRWKKKGGREDLEKARKYLNWLIDYERIAERGAAFMDDLHACETKKETIKEYRSHYTDETTYIDFSGFMDEIEEAVSGLLNGLMNTVVNDRERIAYSKGRKDAKGEDNADKAAENKVNS